MHMTLFFDCSAGAVTLCNVSRHCSRMVERSRDSTGITPSFVFFKLVVPILNNIDKCLPTLRIIHN